MDPRVLALEYELVNPNGSNKYTELQAVSNLNMEDILHRADPSFFDYDSLKLKIDDEGILFYFLELIHLFFNSLYVFKVVIVYQAII